MSLLKVNAMSGQERNAEILVLTTRTELEALREEWRGLGERCERATPFQSPDWLLPWLRHLGGGELRVVTLREPGRRLVAVAAMIVDANPWRGGERTAWLVGNGVSDYGDVWVERGWATELNGAIVAEGLTGTGAVWIDWQQLPAESTLLKADAPWRERAMVEKQEVCPTVRLSGSPRAWLPANWRKKMDYERRRIERTVAVEFVRADEANVDALFAALVTLHGARWADAGGGVVAAAPLRAFHEKVVRGMLANGMLRLYALRANGAIVACYYGFLAGARAFYYLGGFDPAWEKFGVGNLIVDYAMTEAAREGATAFDFLRGGEAYKYRWGAQDEPTYRLELDLRRG
jgi:CelD/BcsL family acetyltransferase involved in cellulose biosynthesis